MTDVHKRLGKADVLRGVTTELRQGQVVGLLGANGCGKTTLLRVAAAIFTPDSGDVEIVAAGTTRRVQRGDVAVLTEEPGLRSRLTPLEELHLVAGLFSIPKADATRRINELADVLNFGSFLQQRSATLSKGTKQKVALARALLPRCPFLLLDEPMANVDPATRSVGTDYIRRLSESEGVGVLVTTHVLNDLDDDVDRVVVLYDGQIATELDADELDMTSVIEVLAGVRSKEHAP